MCTIIGIDTGENIGIAVIGEDKAIQTVIISLQKDRHETFTSLVTRVENFLISAYNLKKSIVVIENFSLYGSPRSIIAAVSGKLNAVITTSTLLADRLRPPITCECKLISPRWKGTMNDKMVQTRVKDVMTRKDLVFRVNCKRSSHEWDAVGLALHRMGLFNEKL